MYIYLKFVGHFTLLISIFFLRFGLCVPGRERDEAEGGGTIFIALCPHIVSIFSALCYLVMYITRSKNSGQTVSILIWGV